MECKYCGTQYHKLPDILQCQRCGAPLDVAKDRLVGAETPIRSATGEAFLYSGYRGNISTYYANTSTAPYVSLSVSPNSGTSYTWGGR